MSAGRGSWPAFPSAVALTSSGRMALTPEHLRGMTQRAYVASQVTEYEVRNALEYLGNTGGLADCQTMGDRMAAARLHVADALLKALEQ